MVRSFAPRFALFLALALVAFGAQAQFGKNKVQYRNFDWQIYHSPHFDVYYYTADQELLKKTVSFAESAYDELSRALDYQIEDPVPLIIYETHSAFQQTNVILNGVPEGAGAFATPQKFRIVLPVDQPGPELLSLLRHELTHIFQYHILFRGRVSFSGAPPLWFMEGMASYYGRDELPADRKYMVDAVVNDNLPSVESLGGGFMAYRYGNSVFRFIEERWGKETILDFIYEFRNTFGSRIGKAIERTFRLDVEDFDSEFRRWARKRYLPELLSTGEPGDFGRPFRLDRGKIGNEMSPAASPSGDLVAALTTDRGELDLSLFDTKTRRRIKNLTPGINTEIREVVIRTNRQIGGDLAFSPDGNILAAFVRREAGRSLALYDVLKGDLKKMVEMEIEQQRSPAFSADGRFLAFSANKAGTNDIYLIDLDTYEIQNITKDEVFDAAPAFSPDGRWLAYTAYLGEHAQIMRLDLKDPSLRYQITSGDFNNKEPAYSLDGKRLYFTSDRTGNDNIYGLDFATGDLRQYTNAITGCDRPTVLPLPEGGERLVYASFWKGRFGLFTTEINEPIGEKLTMVIPEEPAEPAKLARFESDIEVAVDPANNEDYGGFKFFLESIDNFVGVDSDQFLVGRVVLGWSDYLGDRRIIASLSAVETLSDFDLVYFDFQKRRQWGVRVFDDRRYFLIDTNPNPALVEVDRIELFSQTGAEYINIYPFSFNRRIELTAGYYYRDVSGFFSTEDEDGNLVTVVEPRTDDFPQLRAQFVSDTTVFGQWGPVAGHRFRVSASYAPDLDDSGALFHNVELDARKYVPITRRSSLAFRLRAYDSDGNSPNAIGIGGIDTVRGFRTNSLIGFRAGYANVEYRFPLLDQLSFPGLGFAGIRGVVFVDIGTTYFPGITDFDFLDDDDRLDSGVAAYGWGFDLTLFGLPVHWDFAKRTDLKDSETFDTNFWIGFRF